MKSRVVADMIRSGFLPATGAARRKPFSVSVKSSVSCVPMLIEKLSRLCAWKPASETASE